jgi:hypothetical protein
MEQARGIGLAVKRDSGGEFAKAVGLERRVLERGRKGRPTCADCYFHVNRLCALDLANPCSTFRQDGPEGLVPPRQPSLLLRQPSLIR